MARIEQSIEINAPAREAYEQLMQFEQYPRFMDDVKAVRQIDDTHLRWHTRNGNLDMEWDAEITQQIPERCIAWRTTNGPHYEGRIELEPNGDECTFVTLTMECEPHAQVLAQHGDAEQAVKQHAEHDLARFKKFIERLGGEQTRPPPADAGGKERAAATKGDGSAQAQDSGQGGAQRQGNAQAQGGEQAQAGGASWFPPNLLQAWNEPFGLVRKMTEDMDQLIDRFMGHPMKDARLRTGGMTGWTPPVEVAQRGQQFIVCAELPGARREDVQVEVSRDRLTIEGERRSEPQRDAGEYRRSERAYGRFYRVIPLPPGADPDAASASMQDGLLEITVPLPSDGRQGRRLEINARQS